MKYYDKIYIPVATGDELKYVYQCNYLLSYGKEIMATKINLLMLKEVEGPAVVLTVEELREMYDLGIKEILRYITHEGWNYASASGKEDVYVRQVYLKSKIDTLLKQDDGYAWLYNFNTYLQSKGVTI